MSNIKLTLTKEGANSLRKFAKSLPIAVQNIRMSTNDLLKIYRSVSDKLGAHGKDIELLIAHIDNMQSYSTDAITILVPKMNQTADKIDNYVNHNSFAKECSDLRVASTQDIPKTVCSPNIEKVQYSVVDVATYLSINNRDLVVAYSKDANVVTKMYHEFSEPITHPITGEKLYAVKGYYKSSGNGSMNCVYAEYSDKNGTPYSYVYHIGKSVSSQILNDSRAATLSKQESSSNVCDDLKGANKSLHINPQLFATTPNLSSERDIRTTVNELYSNASKTLKRDIYTCCQSLSIQSANKGACCYDPCSVSMPNKNTSVAYVNCSSDDLTDQIITVISQHSFYKCGKDKNNLLIDSVIKEIKGQPISTQMEDIVSKLKQKISVADGQIEDEYLHSPQYALASNFYTLCYKTCLSNDKSKLQILDVFFPNSLNLFKDFITNDAQCEYLFKK